MEKVIEKLKKLTGCKYVKILKRGNNAIYAAFYVVSTMGYHLRIPDQGGWFKYKDYPKKLGVPFDEYPTKDAMITQESFDSDTATAYVVTQPGGYFVQHDLKMVRNNVSFFILDASGSIGNADVEMSGADIVVGSFSEWKPVDLGHGGFFATNNKEIWELASTMFDRFEHELDASMIKLLNRKLDRLADRYSLFRQHCNKIKADLKDFKILYPESNGICVVVEFENEDEMNKIIEYCEANRYEHVKCPRYNKVNKDAISIEVKRLT
ncbi:MAG: hypothetical protein KAT43_02920 [Nanoarchaeota archaeon]|nr:hypothetical protein [Nanoarchaeota archaeon]